MLPLPLSLVLLYVPCLYDLFYYASQFTRRFNDSLTVWARLIDNIFGNTQH
jgi:hypothetical protein